MRKIYGHDELRLLRCRRGGEAFSERRGTALFNTKLSEAKASYESALLAVCGRRYPLQGRGRRPRVRWRQGLAYGQVHKSDKRGRVDRVEVRAVHGKAHREHVLYL